MTQGAQGGCRVGHVADVGDAADRLDDVLAVTELVQGEPNVGIVAVVDKGDLQTALPRQSPSMARLVCHTKSAVGGARC